MELDGKMAPTPDAATLRSTPAIVAMIGELNGFKGVWRAIVRLAPVRLSGLRRIATIESIGSSTRIEGAKFSNRDVEILLSNLELRSFATRDEQEVAGYADAMETVFAHRDAVPLTENHIRQLHRDLLIRAPKKTRWPISSCMGRGPGLGRTGRYCRSAAAMD
jgi:Fic family protein